MASWIAKFEVQQNGHRLGWLEGGTVKTDVVPSPGDAVSFSPDYRLWGTLALDAGNPTKVSRLHHLVRDDDDPSTVVFLLTSPRVTLDELAQQPGWLASAAERYV